MNNIATLVLIFTLVFLVIFLTIKLADIKVQLAAPSICEYEN